MKVVKVLWVDSCNSNMNWTVAEDIEVEPMYINSFGIVVKDTDESLAIAQNYGDNPKQYSNITTIPKGCIKEVFVLHEDYVCEQEHKSEEPQNEEELSDFEAALFSAFSDAWQQYLHGEEVDMAQWAKEHSAELLEAAKQEPVEWSKKDKNYYDAIIAKLEVTQDDAALTDNQMNFLKSLKKCFS